MGYYKNVEIIATGKESAMKMLTECVESMPMRDINRWQ